MPRKECRERVERGLYRSGKTYFACATAEGSRQAIWKTLGEVNLMDARRLRDEFVVETRRTQAPARKPRVTFADAAVEWMKTQEQRVAFGDLRQRTLDIYEQGLRLHVLPELGSRQVTSITPDDLVAWHRRRQSEGYTADSIHAWWTPLRLVLAHAVRHGSLPANPADKLLAHERPKAGQSRRRFLNRKEIQQLLGAASDHYRLAIETGIFAGLRLGEVLALRWRDIDHEEGVIRVRAQLDRNGDRNDLKTAAAHRDVVLMPQLAREFRKHRLAAAHSRDDDLIFATTTGRTVGHRNFAKRGVGKAAARAGLTGVTFHALRHTFASLLIDQGHDPVFVSRQLGHANPAITLRVYAHLFDSARHAELARAGLESTYRELFG